MLRSGHMKQLENTDSADGVSRYHAVLQGALKCYRQCKASVDDGDYTADFMLRQQR